MCICAGDCHCFSSRNASLIIKVSFGRKQHYDTIATEYSNVQFQTSKQMLNSCTCAEVNACLVSSSSTRLSKFSHCLLSMIILPAKLFSRACILCSIKANRCSSLPTLSRRLASTPLSRLSKTHS